MYYLNTDCSLGKINGQITFLILVLLFCVDTLNYVPGFEVIGLKTSATTPV